MRKECIGKGLNSYAYIGPRDFGGLLISNEIVNPLRRLLGPCIVLFGDSSCQSGIIAASGSPRHFHVDAKSDDFDYSRPYPILRIGIYLQDHDVYSGGLKLRPGSWTRFCIDQYGIRRFIKFLIRERSLGQLRPPPGSINPVIRARDLVVWNLRMHHSGFAARLRQAPQRSFHPLIEDFIPRSILCPEQHLRCVIFATYGALSIYLDRYTENRWRTPELVDSWQRNGACDAEYQQLASSRGLELRVPQSRRDHDKSSSQ